jgi:hypothetical protein
MANDDPRRRYLDQPFVLEIGALEAIRDPRRPLARTGHSALPSRMRNSCAQMHRSISAMLRELRRHPEALHQERATEEGGP